MSARAALCLALAAAAAPLAAQEGPRLVTGFEMREVSYGPGLGTKTVRQTAVPIGFGISLGRRLALDASVRYAMSEREDESGAKTSLNGLTDTQLRGVLHIIPDVLLVTASANLPTGATELTQEQLLVAGQIASDLIAFPVSTYGSGLSVTSGLALAVPFGSWALGVAGSYRFSGEFTPIADTTGATYRPGAETRVRVGLDRLLGQGRMSLGFTYSTFSIDEYAGTGAFQPGTRYVSQASWNIPIGNFGIALYAWDVYRTSGEAADELGTVPTEKQHTLTTGGALSVQIGRHVFRPWAEYRQQWEGLEAWQIAGRLTSAGLRVQWQLGSRLQLVPTFRYDTGTIPLTGGDVSLTGFSAGLTVRATL